MATLDDLDKLAASALEGYLVRKDLVRTFRQQFPVPTYVVEFLLGRYCASIKESEISEGLEIVQKQLESKAVRAGEEDGPAHLCLGGLGGNGPGRLSGQRIVYSCSFGGIEKRRSRGQGQERRRYR